MTKLMLTDSEPEPESRPKRRSDDNLIVKHWLPLVLVVITLFGTGRDGFGWIFGRESNERQMAAEIVQLRAELAAQVVKANAAEDAASRTYVRQDVYSITLENINARLASIDRKLSEQKR